MNTRPFQFESRKSLLKHVDNYYQGNYKLIENFPDLIAQKGSTCKLVAVMNALTYHYTMGNLNHCPLPLYKNRDQKVTLSARQVAKKKAGSAVGEMYTEKMFSTFIKGLGETTGDETLIDAKIEFKRFEDDKSNQDSYVNYLKKTIDENNNIPIIFFDVEVNSSSEGQPRPLGDGSQEHGAIVVGYCYDKTNISFILGQWGNYYIVDGKELAAASSHLAMKHSPAKFYKIKNNKISTEWTPKLNEYSKYLPYIPLTDLEKKDHIQFQYENTTHTIYKRIGFQNKENEPGFRSTICVITPKSRRLLDIKDEKKPNSQTILIQHFDSTKYILKQNLVDAIANIEKESFAKGMCNTDVFNYIHNQGYQLLIAKMSDKIIGTLFFKMNKDHIYINNIIIKKDFQYQGVGTLLMNTIIEKANTLNLNLRLESPPRNQKYYEKFGFKVMKKIGNNYWCAFDDSNQKFYIRELPMMLNISAIKVNPPLPFLKISKPVDDKWRENQEGKSAIEAVKKLAVFAKHKTSFMYGLSIRSKSKEAAFASIEEELSIQLSTIKQKTALTEKILASIIISILKNAMIVRGYGLMNERSSSGETLFHLLKGKTGAKNSLTTKQISDINHLLNKYYFNIHNYPTYETLRKKIFGKQSYFSRNNPNPYHYYEGPMEIEKSIYTMKEFKKKLSPLNIKTPYK